MSHPFSFIRNAAFPLIFSLLSVASVAAPAAEPTPEQLVDGLNGVFGQHAGARAVHAKGVILEGTFEPTSAAATLTTAPHFQRGATPVVVRFSDFAGIPDIPDTHPLASPRGMAVKFRIPGGQETDIVAHSFNGFPAADAGEFRDLLTALATSGKDAPKPTPLETFLAGHPAAKTFLETPKPPPVSFASLPYFGVNAFKFTNASGESVHIRYRLIPTDGAKYLGKEEAGKAPSGYLNVELLSRVSAAPVRFRLVAQIAESGDKIDDPSVAWPDNRKIVDLGTITLRKGIADAAAAEKDLIFLPGSLTKGIVAADPMIGARDAAYPVSFSRRNQ